jgi:hypothetical protein
MSPLDLLGKDIRSRLVTEFLEIGGVTMIDLDVIEDRAFIAANEQGVSIMAGPEYQIDTLHFYAEGVQGSHGYAGELPLNVHFGQKRNELLNALGKSSKSGGGRLNVKGEMIPKWDRFDFDTFSIHLQFSVPTDALELVTVMTREVVAV